MLSALTRPPVIASRVPQMDAIEAAQEDVRAWLRADGAPLLERVADLLDASRRRDGAIVLALDGGGMKLSLIHI